MTNLSSDFGGPTQLMAAFSPDNSFLGLLADSPAGLYVRADGSWMSLSSDNRVFSGAQVLDVDDDYLDFFDKLDQRGTEPTYDQTSSYALSDDGGS